MNRVVIILTTLLVTALTACDKTKVYNQYVNAPIKGWEKNEAVILDIDPLDEGGTYSLLLGMRISEEYPFRNLHMVVEQTIYPSGKTLSDTITCHVVDKHGNMLGHGVSLYQYDLPIRKRFYLHGDSIHIRVRHNMKREILPGISDVGITLRKN